MLDSVYNLSGMAGASLLADYPNPFATYSNRIYPVTIYDVFKWAEWLWLRHGTYTQAVKTGVRYFLSDIELYGAGVGLAERKKYRELLLDDLHLLDQMALIGDDYIGFGNSFSSVVEPIARSITCVYCGTNRALSGLVKDVDYKFEDYKFKGKCPACNKHNDDYVRVDEKAGTPDHPFNLVRWAPACISIDHCHLSGVTKYYYNIPADEAAMYKNGDELTLQTAPWEIFECVKAGKPLALNPLNFKHIKCPVGANIDFKAKGWGLPPFMCSFNHVVQLQILERFCEALAMDYIAPFRVVTPPASVGGQDPLLATNQGQFLSNVRRMIQEHKLDPTTWHTLPFPIHYSALGGEARAVIPIDLLQYAQEALLSDMSIPIEFHKASLRIGGPPISLRMFEKNWSHYVKALNQWLDWYVGQVGRSLGWERVRARINPPSEFEDIEVKQIKLSLASAGQISMHTALAAIGIDYDYEVKKLQDEAVERDKSYTQQTKRMNDIMMNADYIDQAKMAAMQSQLAPPGGAVPVAGAPAGGMLPPMGGLHSPSVEELVAQGTQLAQQLMTMDQSTRISQLINLKKQSPELHAIVKQKLEDLENQAGMQGIRLARAGHL